MLAYLITLFCPIAVHVLKENCAARLVLAVVLVVLVAVVVGALLSRRSGSVVDECVEAMRLCSCHCSYDSYTRRSFCCVLVLTLRVLRSFSLILLFERFVRLLALLLSMLDPPHVSMRVLHIIVTTGYPMIS